MTQAISLDTGFAMAYRKLAIELQNRGLQRERSLGLLQKAFDHADRLSEKERYIMLGSYYNQGPKPDEDKAASAYESLLEIDPENVTALNNVASIYHERGDYAKAIEMAKRAVAVQPTASVFFENLVHNSLHLGQMKVAQEAVALAAKNMPRNPRIPELRAQVLVEQGHADSISAVLDSLEAARPTDLNTRRSAESIQASVSELDGRISGFERHMGNARAAGLLVGNPQAAMGAKLDSAYALYWYRDQPEKALQMLERAVASSMYTSLKPEERPYGELLDAYVHLGKPDKARALLADVERLPESKTPNGQRALHAANGSILRAEKKYDEAVREFTAGQDRGCPQCVLPEIATTYDLAGKPDSAIGYYTKFLDAKATPMGVRSTWVALSHKRLGELYENKGNVAQAATHYEKFVELWKNADADMQPRVAEVKRRLQKLTSTDRPKS
jgi:tetratricopeptide (TPR) repeat protein